MAEDTEHWTGPPPNLAGTVVTASVHIFCGIVGEQVEGVCRPCVCSGRGLRGPVSPAGRGPTDRRAAGADHVRSGTPRFAGAGVLALPRSIAYLGWVAGPLMIIVFYLVSLLTSL